MKGLAIGATVILVLGVILLFVVVPRMVGIENIANAFDPLGYKKRLASLGYGDDLERATRCAQDRCFKGCGYLKEENFKNDIRWKHNEVSCYEQFCKKEKLDSLKLKEGDKVCNDNSKSYPVEFQILDKDPITAIQADDLETFGCVVPAPSTCSSGGFTQELVSDKTVLYIDKNLIIPESVSSEGAGIFSRDCGGKLDMVKYGENAVTFLVPGGVIAKGTLTGIKIGAFKVLKQGVTQIRVKSAIVAGGAGGALTEAFFQQIRIIKSVELKPIKDKIFIWARDYGGVGGLFRGFGAIIATAKKGTSDHVVLCSAPPSDCKGKPIPCMERDRDTCKEELGCKLVGDICTSLPQSGQKGFTGRAIDVPVDVVPSQPKACEDFLTDNACGLQPGCCWKDECKKLEARLGGIDKTDEEFKGFERALKAVGGEEKALTFWGIWSNDIKELYEMPKKIEDECIKLSGKDSNFQICKDNWKTLGFRSWKEFRLCKYTDDKGNEISLVPGTCAIDRINKAEPAYCLADGGNLEPVNYPLLCGCAENYGTIMGEGEIGGQCKKFDSDNIQEIGLGFYDVDETYDGGTYKIPIKESRTITASLLDNNQVVVTGIKQEDVAFTVEPAGLAKVDDTICEESGSVAYISCKTGVTSDKAGIATVMFEYKPKNIKGSINVRFTAPAA